MVHGVFQVTAESVAHLLERVGKADMSKVARHPSEGQLNDSGVASGLKLC